MSNEKMYDIISAVFASASSAAFLVITALMLIEDRMWPAVISSVVAGIFITIASYLRSKYEKP